MAPPHIYLTLSQAAQETGRSKSVISQALKTGKLSYVSKDENGYKIDPAELFRVFEANPQNDNKNPQAERSRTPVRTGENALENVVRVATLESENALLQARIRDKDERITELKEERDRWKEEKDRWHKTAQRLLLTYQPSPDAPEKPVEDEKGRVGAETANTPVKSSYGPNLAIYGLFLIGLLTLSLAMNYFQEDIRVLIDRVVLGQSAPETAGRTPAPERERVEERQEERALPQRSRSLPEPYPF